MLPGACDQACQYLGKRFTLLLFFNLNLTARIMLCFGAPASNSVQTSRNRRPEHSAVTHEPRGQWSSPTSKLIEMIKHLVALMTSWRRFSRRQRADRGRVPREKPVAPGVDRRTRQDAE